MDFSNFIDYVKTQPNKEFITIGNQKTFTVDCLEDHILILPTSTSKQRKEKFDTTSKIFDMHLVSDSYKTTDYSDITRNSSYILALLRDFYSDSNQTE